MTTRATARIALIDALRELERWDDQALDAAFHHAQRAAFLVLDLRGTTDPIRLAAPEVEPPGLTDARRPPGEGLGNSRGGVFSAPVPSTDQAPSCPGDSQAKGQLPTGTEGSASGAALTAPNVRDVQGGR